VRLSHHRAGSGEPLVLLHGIGMEWRAWLPLIERLVPERDVIAIDLPGFGGSRALPAGTAPDAAALAVAVAAFLDELGIDRPVVGGLSLGGLVGLELAKRGRARAVVAISPAGFASTIENVGIRAHLRLDLLAGRRAPGLAVALMPRPRGRALLLAGMIGHPGNVPVADAQAMWRALATSTAFEETLAQIRPRWFEHGERIDVPVAILWGTRDRLLNKRQAKRAAAAIPGARSVPLPGGGHIPFWDAPDAIVRELLAA
jgi:pimeloyl-ACP methyl ester carboxylesterase